MQLKPEEISKIIRAQIKHYENAIEQSETGTVIMVGDGIARASGLEKCMAGELLQFDNGEYGMAQNLEENTVSIVLLGTDAGIKEGSIVKRTGKVVSVPVGDAMIGRVVNALGQPIDGAGPIETTEYRAIESRAPGIIERQPVKEPLQTGIKAIDSMIPIGRGQRELIIGDRQTGKTTIASDTIINQKGKDVICIYVAIGQKRSTVANLVQSLTEAGAMGYTIVFCMCASLLSAIAIVPLCYMMYKPKERSSAPATRPLTFLQDAYRKIMSVLLKHKAIVMLASVGIIVATVFLASGMQTELMTADDTGTVSVSIETRPGLITEQADAILAEAESIVADHEDVESYMLRYNNDEGTITAYLKDDRKMSTDEVVSQWENEMADLENCTITVEASTSMSMMGRSRGYEAILKGTQYDELQEVSNEIVNELIARDDVKNVHSSIENTAPVVAVKVDPVAASAEGLTAAQIGTMVKQMLDGEEVTTLKVDGQEISVRAEYPEDQYKTVPQLERIILKKPSGGYVALSDVAEIYYKDSPSSIEKEDKSYQITISADYVDSSSSAAVKTKIDNEVISPNLTGTITRGTNSRDRMMQEEFSGLYNAIAVAVFLIFVVMAAQFESPKFSFMVMTTIPFSLVGSFGLLKLTGVSMSMTSILGFLILVGTVVNNGILYVDTVNQYRMEMPLRKALIEAGATRMRPIMMTSLTTILSMLPMAMAFGSSGSTTQGLAVVNIGGLSVGVLVALFILPVYYALMNGRKELRVLDI